MKIKLDNGVELDESELHWTVVPNEPSMEMTTVRYEESERNIALGLAGTYQIIKRPKSVPS